MPKGKQLLLEHLNVPGINTLEVYRQQMADTKRWRNL